MDEEVDALDVQIRELCRRRRQLATERLKLAGVSPAEQAALLNGLDDRGETRWAGAVGDRCEDAAVNHMLDALNAEVPPEYDADFGAVVYADGVVRPAAGR